MKSSNLTAEAAPAAEFPGLVLRTYAGEADIPDVVRLQNAEWAAVGTRGRVSVDEYVAWWGHPNEKFDPARDVRIAELDGRVVAFAQSEWVDTTDGLREYRSGGAVDPDFARRGIGSALLADRIAAARTLDAGYSDDRPRILGMWVDQRNAGGAALAERFGYEPARWFFDMERPISGDVPEIEPLPEGLELRPMSADQAWELWTADHEAFRDHWGGHDDSEANFRRWRESPEFDPTMFLVAWDGDEIAGGVLNAIYPEENEALGLRRGWLDSVFTRRPWRRRGLARNLIVRSFHLLRGRGMTDAALGVDADNPSGALGLYESVGFAVVERSTAWRRPLEEAAA
jgi:mycothiol synthase